MVNAKLEATWRKKISTKVYISLTLVLVEIAMLHFCMSGRFSDIPSKAILANSHLDDDQT